MQDRKFPQRQCAGCRARLDKRNLIRVVRDAEGLVSIDLTGRKNGRGAYICPKAECLEHAVKTKALERALGAAIAPETYEKLRKEINEQ